MRYRLVVESLAAACVLAALIACGPAETPKQSSGAEAPTARIVHATQENFSRFMPPEGRTSVSLVEGPLLGVAQFPGGTFAEYRKNGKSFQQILFKAPSVAMTAVYLGHGKDAMDKPKFVAGFGGYFGEIDDKPVFLFVKNEYVTALIGLPLNEADAEGRVAAARIP